MTNQILSATLLLLSLFTYTTAQNRSAQETLTGLREIGVVVKYANVDGLESAMQPSILLMLQDRATNALKYAGIPVLQSQEESDLHARPHLVFTVTVNKPAANAPLMIVEASLNERVRLWRDDTKEMELGTWVYSGFGYAARVTTQLLIQVFDGQVNRFIKDYRAVNPQPTLAVSTTTAPAPPAQPAANGNSLQGLSVIDLFIWSGPGGSPEPRLAALIKTVQGQAEMKFKDAGIPLFKFVRVPEGVGHPLLYVYFKLNPPDSPAPAIEVEGKFWQEVRPLRDLTKQTYAVTWELQTNNDGPITDEAVVQLIGAQVDEFIKAYKAANPRIVSQANR